MSLPPRWSALLLLALPGLTILLAPTSPGAVEGVVYVEGGATVHGASVRWQGTNVCTRTDPHGQFQLPSSPSPARRLTAWKEGFRIAAAAKPPLTLQPLPLFDNEDYRWVDPRPDPRQPHNCGNCHQAIYDEWAGSAHARSATNPNFLRLFAGSDGTTPPRPTWNLLLEHPDGAGVCAACHAPTFHDSDLTYDVRQAKGVAARGVHCDYCHKIADAPTDKLGTRFGRDGLRLLRPAQDDQLFFGPLDDAVRPGESFAYLPLYKESRYCASCHEGVLFGVHVYGTYSEWLASPARSQGKSCQSCHMTPTGHMTNIAPGKGGIQRDPKTLASHHFPGGAAAMLQRSVNLTCRIKSANVTVTLEAHDVGHAVPTGFIDRHLLLVVEGFDQAGQPLPLHKGPLLPNAAGPGWTGLPGFLYAKRLTGEDGRSPLPFWLPPAKVDDTRLRPGQPDQQRFQFADNLARVRVRVLYRRLWPAAEPEMKANEFVLFDRIEKK